MRSRFLVASLAALISCGTVSAADPPKGSDLDIVPTSSFAFLTVRVSDLNTVEALKPVKEAVARLEKLEGSVAKLTGVPLGEMDRVTFFWPVMLSTTRPARRSSWSPPPGRSTRRRS